VVTPVAGGITTITAIAGGVSSDPITVTVTGNEQVLTGTGRAWGAVDIDDDPELVAVHYNTFQGKNDVLKITSPGGRTDNTSLWDPLRYSLNEYRGQDITVVLSVNVWVDKPKTGGDADTPVWWKANAGSWPIIADNTPTDDTDYGRIGRANNGSWVKLSTSTAGKATGALNQDGAFLYLQGESDNGEGTVEKYIGGIPLYFADFEVTVKSPGTYNELSGISIDGAESRSATAGDEISLSAVLAPLNATRTTVRWTSSNPAVASVAAVVDSEDKEIPGLAVVTVLTNGTAVITASSDETKGGVRFTDTVTITVSGGGVSVPESGSVSVNASWASSGDQLALDKTTVQLHPGASTVFNGPAGGNYTYEWKTLGIYTLGTESSYTFNGAVFNGGSPTEAGVEYEITLLAAKDGKTQSAVITIEIVQ
jgi:hypothetical protein